MIILRVRKKLKAFHSKLFSGYRPDDLEIHGRHRLHSDNSLIKTESDLSPTL